MVAAISEGLGTVLEALLDKGASVHRKLDGVSESGEGDVSRVLTCCSVL